MKKETKIYKVMNTPFSLTFKSAMVSFLAEWYGFIWDLRWMIVFGILLVIGDLWFGISESKYKKRKIVWSNARSKTLIKSIDYLCYVTIGIALGKAIAQPYGLDPLIVATTMLLTCYMFELNSIYKHICTIHDVNPKYDLWDFLLMIITFKFKKFFVEFMNILNQIKSIRESRKS